MAEFWAFLRAVFSHWVAIMSGVASLAIAAWEQLKRNQTSKRLFLSIALLCLLFACYLAWRDNYRSVQALTAEADRPYFTVSAPGFKALNGANNPFRLIIPMDNTGVNPARELEGTITWVDQFFKASPGVETFSVANDIPHGSTTPWYNDTVALGTEVPPQFFILSLKYLDAKRSGPKLSQIFYMKWSGVRNGKTEPDLVHVSIPERDYIIAHLNGIGKP